MVVAIETAISFYNNGGVRQWHRLLKHYCAGPSLRAGVEAVMSVVMVSRAVEMVECSSTCWGAYQTSGAIDGGETG